MTCERCGYPGPPISWHGRPSGCPRCEQFSHEGLELARELHEQGFAIKIRQRRRLTLDEHRRAGRNDPCPCGSGSKFKRCHGR